MIEKGGKAPANYAGQDTSPGGDNEPEGDESETASIPTSLIGGQQVKPGDVIRLKVISVDAENGAINVAYDHGDEAEAGGSDSMANDGSFDAPPPDGGQQM